MSKRASQARAIRIRAFREEVAALSEEGVLEFEPHLAERLRAHHDAMLARFSAEHDVDISAAEQRLSWGMRIASAVGALAFSLAVFLFFEYYWDKFPTAVQVALVTLAPFLAWGATEFIHRRFRNGYFTGIAALVSLACFVANLVILGEIFDIYQTPNALLAWGLFGTAMAYRYQLPHLLGFSLYSLIGFAGAWLTIQFGYAWPDAAIPELYLFASLMVLLAPLWGRRFLGQEYVTTYAFVGLLGIFLVLKWVVVWPRGSWLPITADTLEWAYDVFAIAVASVAVWQCIQRNWRLGGYLSTAFLILYMLYDYCDWLWDEMPGYLFFLVLGGIATAVILSLRKLRIGARKETA